MTGCQDVTKGIGAHLAWQSEENLYFTHVGCRSGPSSVACGDLDKVVELRAGVIISQDGDLHLQEKAEPRKPADLHSLQPSEKQEDTLQQLW